MSKRHFMPKIEKGTRFCRLTTVKKLFKRKSRWYWSCLCDCGNGIVASENNLNTNNTKSCGCLQIDATTRRSTKHGQGGRLGKTAEYMTWKGIHNRCNSATDKDYGGRGVAVCDRWSGPEGFANFFADMGRKPSSDHSIDRKDTNGSYSPDNCRWATSKEQSRNKRNNRLIEYNGRVQCLAAWAEELGMKIGTLNRRICRNGWSVERAMTQKMRMVKS